MTINYLIIVHKNMSQVDRLIEILDNGQARFFLHVDSCLSKASLRQFRFNNNKNVTLIKRRVHVNWGGFSMIAATLSLLKAAASRVTDGYFVLLSGQDFPVKKNCMIYEYLFKDYGAEYIECTPFPVEKWISGGYDRIHYHWFIDEIGILESYYLFGLQKGANRIRPYFEEIHPYGGSQWWCLTFEAVQYILKFLKTNSNFLEYYRFTFIPDEMFFQTILMNSPFRQNIVNDNLRYINMPENDAHPTILRLDDFEIVHDSRYLWARKFDMLVDSAILDKIHEHLS